MSKKFPANIRRLKNSADLPKYDGKSKNGGPELVYEVMLFDEKGNYFLFVGLAAEEFEKNLAAYRKIAATLKRK